MAKRATKKRAKKMGHGHPYTDEDEGMDNTADVRPATRGMPTFMLFCNNEDGHGSPPRTPGSQEWTGYALEATTLEEAQAEAKRRLLGSDFGAEIDWENGEFYWAYGEIGEDFDAGDGLADNVGSAYIVALGNALPLQEWSDHASAWEERMREQHASMSEEEVQEAKEAYELKAAKEKFERLSAKMDAKTDPSVSRGRRAA